MSLTTTLSLTLATNLQAQSRIDLYDPAAMLDISNWRISQNPGEMPKVNIKIPIEYYKTTPKQNYQELNFKEQNITTIPDPSVLYQFGLGLAVLTRKRRY